MSCWVIKVVLFLLTGWHKFICMENIILKHEKNPYRILFNSNGFVRASRRRKHY